MIVITPSSLFVFKFHNLSSLCNTCSFVGLDVTVAEISFWTKLLKCILCDSVSARYIKRETEQEREREQWEKATQLWQSGICAVVCVQYMCVPVCRRVCVCWGSEGHPEWRCRCVYACVSVQIPLERVRWRLSSASTSICREGTNKLLNTQQTALRNYL